MPTYSTEVEELEESNATQIEKILDRALELFLKRGIDSVTMAEIANASKISENELYKIFQTKEQLVVRTATFVWTKRMDFLFPTLLKPKYNTLKGIDQLRDIFNLFVKLYEKETDSLKFIYLFDAFAVKNKIPKEDMANYEAKILLVKQIISDAIQKGIADGTINEKYIEYGEMLYFTLMHTFFCTAQKLSLTGNLLNMDTKKNGSMQLKLLAELLLKSLG